MTIRKFLLMSRSMIWLSLAVIVVAYTQSCTSKTRDSKVEKLALYEAIDFSEEGIFTSGIEGPVYVDGYLYAVNFKDKGTIGRVDLEGHSEMFVRLPEGSVGNGLRVNDLGDLYVADYTGHNILKIDRVTKNIEVFAHSDSMSQPNDIAIRSDGTLFASDPSWATGTGQLWRIETDGSVHLLEKNMGTTNGIELSPDETKLYVNESVQRKVWRYNLSVQGNISNKELFHEFADFGMDGMRCDQVGNLFVTRHGKGTVAILSPEGDLVREVQLKGKKPSNIAFGGSDGRTCFVPLQDRGMFEIFRSEHPGRSFHLTIDN